MSKRLSLSEKHLFKKVSEGNELAFQLLFEQYYQRMLSFVYSLVKSSFAAEEIVQEAFIRLWENRDLLADVRKPDDYIFIIVRNHALNYLRQLAKEQKQRVQLWECVKQQAVYTAEPFEEQEAEQLWQKILAKLSPQKQKIFRLSRDMGLTQQEIATQLKLSKNTIKNQIVDSLKVVKEHLKHSYLLFLLALQSIV